MATLEEINQQIENLKKKLEEDVERLEEDIKLRKAEILNLEKVLAEVVQTKELHVTGNAQIAGRNVGQALENYEVRLNNHEQALSQSQTQISQLQTQMSAALSSIQEINNREIFRYTVIPICHYDSPDTQRGSGGRQWTHPCGDSHLIDNHKYSVEGPYFFGLKQ